MKALLCIDDTDNLESIGTGEVLQDLCAALSGLSLASCGYVTRHQLYVHEDIAYTSHNSSMCCGIKFADGVLIRVLETARKYLEENSASGSDPGLCLVIPDYISEEERLALTVFGRKAKSEVLSKQLAYSEASRYPQAVFLSEHGGTGEGIIGALAGCGLRISGMDGRLKGKIAPKNPQQIYKVDELLRECSLDCAITMENTEIPGDEPVIPGEEIKGVYINHQRALVLIADDSGIWRPASKKLLKKY